MEILNNNVMYILYYNENVKQAVLLAPFLQLSTIRIVILSCVAICAYGALHECMWLDFIYALLMWILCHG